ncbi:MAG: hydrophobe/amphiphile efflux-3 (HAE3) family transporter, partial [Dehalococcoidia bacterium]
VISKGMRDMMSSGLRNTLIMSVLLMLAVLVLIFNVRGLFLRRWLPLVTVVLGTIYTFGLMGWLGIPLTMISMSIFAILIGLGVDYGIQFYNRYDEEVRRGRSVAQSIINAVTRMTPAVGTALITVCLAFAALFISPVPMIRDFGLMLLIGLVMCYLVALFVLLSIIYWRDRRSQDRRETKVRLEKVKSEEDSPRHWWLERWLRWFTPKVIGRPAIIIPIALTLTILGWVADPHVGVETNEEEFINQNTPVMRNYQAVFEVTKSMNDASVLVTAEDVLEPDILGWIWDRQQYIESRESDYVAKSSSISGLILQNNGGSFPQSSAEARAILEDIPSLLKTNLVSDDFTAANIAFGVRDVTMDEIRVFNERLREDVANPPPGTDVILTGWPVMGVELMDALTGGRWQITGLGVGLIFVALFFLFRRDILKALMAIVPIGIIVGWSSGLMFLLGIRFTPLTATLGVLILGIGAEYTILVMSRYYEEKAKGEHPVAAMTTAMATIGRAVLVSGLTTIAGFAALLSATDFLILRDFGIVVMIDVAFALLSTIIVLPPLVVWLDGWRDRRRLRLSTASPVSEQ